MTDRAVADREIRRQAMTEEGKHPNICRKPDAGNCTGLFYDIILYLLTPWNELERRKKLWLKFLQVVYYCVLRKKKEEEMKKFIHYGTTGFDRTRFKPIKNQDCYGVNKPYGGLWASPVDAAFGWKDWNEREHFAECNEQNSFRFSVKDDAKVFEVHSRKDVETMLHRFFNGSSFDFEAMSKEYDAVLFYCNSETYYALYGWDCDSILIMNQDIIVLEEETEENSADAENDSTGLIDGYNEKW